MCGFRWHVDSMWPRSVSKGDCHHVLTASGPILIHVFKSPGVAAWAFFCFFCFFFNGIRGLERWLSSLAKPFDRCEGASHECSHALTQQISPGVENSCDGKLDLGDYWWILMMAINKTAEMIQWRCPRQSQHCIRPCIFVGSAFSPPATSLSMLLRLICFHGSSVLFDSHVLFQASLPLPFLLGTFVLCFHLLSSFPPPVFTGHALLPSLWAWHSEVLDENPAGPQS